MKEFYSNRIQSVNIGTPFFARKGRHGVPQNVAFWLAILCLPAIAAEENKLELIRSVPHTGYSEGLDYFENYLWHAIPDSIVKIDPKDGTVLEKFAPATKYSESLMWFKGVLWNLSFSDDGIYTGQIQNRKFAFEKKAKTPEVHGWGITHDGTHVIFTGDYSNKLYFMNPDSYKIVKTLQTDGKDLEDLAWDGVGIWTSSYTTDKGHIFRIDPKTGKRSKLFRIPDVESCPIIDGIAFDGKGLWVTGKNCLQIFYFKKPL